MTVKRIFSLLLALALLAALAGCGKREPTPDKPDEPTPPPEDGITLAELNVEFVAGERNPDELMKLKKELPPLLIDALADEGVTVGKVNVTFGASDEATADALARGTVQVGFVPMETYLAHDDAQRPVCSQIPTPDMSLDTVFLLFTESERSLAAQEQPIASDYVTAHIGELVWLLPEGDETAERFAAYWVERNCGVPFEEVPVEYYTDADALAPDAGDILVLRCMDSALPKGACVFDSCILWGELIVVQAANPITGSDTFALALQNAIDSIWTDDTEGQAVIAHYSSGESHILYTSTSAERYDTTRYVLGYSDDPAPQGEK